MAAKTKIEWCDRTWNPWVGCTCVSAGCAHCYAARSMPARVNGVRWGKGQKRFRNSPSYWQHPIAWNRLAAKRRTPISVFMSLCDWLDAEVPIEWLADALKVIWKTPNLRWLLLTKRPELFRDRVAAAMVFEDSQLPKMTAEKKLEILALAERVKHGTASIEQFNEVSKPYKRSEFSLWLGWWLEGLQPLNVAVGVSVENQACADTRIPELLKIPAEMRFLSCEPLLEEVDLLEASFDGSESFSRMGGIDWVIIGGESGPGARRCNIHWIRKLIRQAQAANAKPFVKQLGSAPKWLGSDLEEQFPNTYACACRFRNRNRICPDCLGKELTMRLDHPKGGQPDEWPKDLRHREFPNFLCDVPYAFSPETQ